MEENSGAKGGGRYPLDVRTSKGTHLCLPRSALAILGRRRPKPTPRLIHGTPRTVPRSNFPRTNQSLPPSLHPWNLCVLPCTVIESPWSHPRFRGNSFVDVEAAISITPPRSGGVFARPANNRTMFSATALPPFKKNRFNSGRDGFPHRRRRRRSSSVDTPIGCSGMIY